ncbi:MAG: hypothetical protein GVY19_04575 [Bacteroidetes bacterium]|jgi:hypothetical protein|nr:hypothetical protein [Bacteroidota bacterium]
MNKALLTLLIALSLVFNSCLKDTNNEQNISYNEESYSFEIELLEDDWYNEIRKYDEDNKLMQTITYDYGTDTIIKRVFDEENEIFDVHYYLVDSNRRAIKSWDTLDTDEGTRQASVFTYTRDSVSGQLQRIDHTVDIIGDGNDTENANNIFAYVFEFDDGDISSVGRASVQTTCYDEYYSTDSVAVLDIYSFRENNMFMFDGRITGEKSRHLMQAVVLSYNCYPNNYYPPEIAMNYQMNADKTVGKLTYLIFPSRSVYANNINAERIIHTFTYMDVE